MSSGVRQGDSLSPTLFVIFIDDLSHETKSLNAGIYIGGKLLHMLLYADDIVQVVHTRNYQKPRSSVPRHCCGQQLEYNVQVFRILS